MIASHERPVNARLAFVGQSEIEFGDRHLVRVKGTIAPNLLRAASVPRSSGGSATLKAVVPAGIEPVYNLNVLRAESFFRWKLMTNRPVEDLTSAIEKLDWYARRRKIETFHKVLKPGCRAERSRLRTAERLTNLLAVLCIVGWRVFWLTMTSRATPEAPAEVALTKAEVEILDRLAGEADPPARPTVSHYLVAIARLGGYLARAKDPPPGNMVIWRGLTRLMDIHLGFESRGRVVGN
jgi:hypothetical protein